MIQGGSLVLAVGIPLTEGIAVEMEEAVVEIDCSKFDKRSVLHHFFAKQKNLKHIRTAIRKYMYDERMCLQ